MKGQILFVDVVSRDFFGVVQEIASLGYEPLFNGGPLLDLSKSHGIASRSWEEWIPADLNAIVERESARLTASIQQAVQTPQGRQALSSSFGNWLPRNGQSFFRDLLQLAVQQIQAVEIVQAIRAAGRLRGVVLGCDNSPVQRGIVLACRRLGVPTVQLAHAIYGHSKAIARPAGEMHTLYSDYVCVFGERAKRDMIEAGTPEDRIVVTGAPHWEQLSSSLQKVNRDEACRRLGLDPTRPVVLYTGGYAEGTSGYYPFIARWMERTFRATVDACKSVGQEVQLIVRPHPHERRRYPVDHATLNSTDEMLRSWARALGHPIAHLSIGDKIDPFRAADIAIATAGSSIIPELMIAGCPVIGVPIFNEAGLLYDESDGVSIAREPADIAPILQRLLNDASERAEMLARQKASLEDLDQPGLSRPSRRIATAVDRIASDAFRHQFRAARMLHGYKRPRVLLAAHDFFPFGKAGTERYTRDLGHALQRRGYDVRVIHPRPVLQPGEACRIEEDYVEGLRVNRLLIPANVHAATRLDMIKPLIREYLTESPVDIVHAQHLMGLGPAFLETVKEFALPIVFTANDFWPLCEQVHLMHPSGQVCSGPETIDKCVQCLRSRFEVKEPEIPQYFYILSDRQYTLKRAMDLVDVVICPSLFLKRTYERHGFVASRMIHLPQGALLKPRQPRELRADGIVRFVYLGHVAYRKGLDLLVRAFNRIKLPNAELHIHGMNSEPPYLAQIMATVPAGSKVIYHGEYSADDMPTILANADLAVVPSRGENYPFVIREILHQGVPVIASNVAGIPEIVTDGRNGRLFRNEDHHQLGDIMRELAENPSAIENLRAGIEPIKSIDDDAADIETIYGHLVGKGVIEGINFTLVAPSPTSPSVSRAEIGNILAHGFVDAGVPVREQTNAVQSSSANLLIGYEAIGSVDAMSGMRTIALQFDPLSHLTEDRRRELTQLLGRASEVWTFSSRDARWFTEKGIKARVLPLGFAGPIPPRTSAVHDIDVLFEGIPNQRQSVAIAELEKFCEVARFQGAFGATRDDLYRRAKIVLLLKPEDMSSIDHARVIHLMRAGALIVAEDASENGFGESIVTASKKDLAETVKQYLSNPELVDKQKAKQEKWLADHPFGPLLRRWMDDHQTTDIVLRSATFQSPGIEPRTIDDLGASLSKMPAKIGV
jgi:glycosyltransferase involved in cell wall biosynthesis/UDP-N-acetylglucosamine:LPS N-acetylglucosamine transferase